MAIINVDQPSYTQQQTTTAIAKTGDAVTTTNVDDDQMDIENINDSSTTPSISQQRSIISKYLDQQMKESQVWCLIEAKWLEAWKHYVRYQLVSKQQQHHHNTAVAADQEESEVADTPEGDHPGAIDNSVLLLQPSDTVITPTDDIPNGGSSIPMNVSHATIASQVIEDNNSDPFLRKIRLDIQDRVHYDLIPQEAYSKLISWYGGGPEIARRTISDNRNIIVELHPHFLLLATNKGVDFKETPLEFKEVSFSKRDTFSKVIEEAKKMFNVDNTTQTRLWRAVNGSPYELISAAEMSEELDIANTKPKGQQIILEVKQDGDWVIEDGDTSNNYEIQSKVTGTAKSSIIAASTSSSSSSPSYLTSSSSVSKGRTSSFSNTWSNEGDGRGDEPGVCGLQNLGNTCFMNSALQCLTKTPQLNQYFTSGDYQSEINETNPLGMGGKIARAFGNLMQEMWSGRHSYISPREFKWTIGKFAPQFSGYQQQDSQELIAYLLDGLHEDLNRILKKPVTEQVESNGRDDTIVATESWENHMKRNDSIIVDKFQGQLKSTLICPQCNNVSITFDPYMYLSLPLPVETSRSIEIILFENGKTPMKYLVKVPKRGSIADLRSALATVAGISPPHRIVIVEIFSFKIYRYLSDKGDIKQIMDNDVLHAHVIDENASISEDIHSLYGQYDSSNLPFISARVCTTRKEDQRYSTGYRSVVVGPPFPILFDKEATTNKELYDYCFNYLRPYIDFDVASEHGIDLTQADLSFVFPDKNFGKNKKAKQSRESDRYGNRSGSYDYVSYNSYSTSNHGDYMRDEEDEDERLASRSDTENEAEENPNENIDNDNKKEEVEANQPPKLHLFYLKFEDTSSYSSSIFDEEGEQGVLPYTDEVVQIPRERFYSSSDKKSLQLYINPEVLDKLIDHKRMVHVENHESTSSRSTTYGVSLDSCLDLFTTQEKLGEEDTWYCPKCKDFVQATKKFDLWSLPEVLVIHLKRFQYNKWSRDKLDTYVDYPLDNFDLEPHVLPHARAKNTKYELFAVSNHFGGLGGGHYTAYAKVLNGQWYKFDDSFVQRCSGEDAKTSAGYVLFYSRKKDDTSSGSASKEE